MRLFLASDDLGVFAKKLTEMVDGSKALVITNARDHRTPENRKQIVDDMLGILTKNGFNAKELDLRPYFGKPEVLRKFIDDEKPDLVFCIGGNFYTLATALRLSGMRKILKEDIAADKYAYGGYSAGAMNAAKDLMYYANTYGKRADDRIEQTRQTYGEVSTDGLGFIDEYVCPHADTEEYREIAKATADSLATDGKEAVVLNDADVLIVSDGKKEILRG